MDVRLYVRDFSLYRSRVGSSVYIKVFQGGLLHGGRRICSIEIAVLRTGAPVKVVLGISAGGSRVSLAVDCSRPVGPAHNLHGPVIYRLLVILREIQFGLYANRIQMGIFRRSLYIPVDTLIPDRIQLILLVVSGIDCLGGRLCHLIGFQAKAHHRVVHSLFPVQACQFFLLDTGESHQRSSQKQHPVFIRSTSHCLFLQSFYRLSTPSLSARW